MSRQLTRAHLARGVAGAVSPRVPCAAEVAFAPLRPVRDFA